MASETNITFENVKERLDEIVDAVNDESISLDDALDLYEEAVKLGMQASTLLEEGLAQQDAEVEADGGSIDEANAASVSGTEQSVVSEDAGAADADERAEDAVSRLQ